jgi:hypothetical protein
MPRPTVSAALRPLLLVGAALLLLPAAPPARGQAAPASAAPAPVQAAAWAPRLRAEYLSGERIVVPFEATNSGDAVVRVPDLAARPWLVQFSLQPEGGQVQRRSTTPPEVDPGGTLSLAPRGRRFTLLEVPGTGSLAPGAYTLAVSILGEDGPVELARRSIRVGPPRPVSGALPDPAAARAVQSTLWLHAAAQGFDLYLHEAPARSPLQVLSHAHLLHLDAKVSPALSATRGTDASNRHVVWLDGPRRLAVLPLRGAEVTEAPRMLNLPWPRAELIGRPATDGIGRLHLPLWVPGPQGAAGELRVLSLGPRGEPHFRRVAALPARPDLEVLVTDDGAAQLLVQNDAAVDLYTIPAEEISADLPVAGRKLWRPAAGERALAARFAPRVAAEGVRAGLALCVLTGTETAVQPRWFSLQGAALPGGQTAARPPAGALVALAGEPSGEVAALWRLPEGLRLQRGGALAPVPADLGRSWALGRLDDGALIVRGLVDGGPLRITALPAPVAPDAPVAPR